MNRMLHAAGVLAGLITLGAASAGTAAADIPQDAPPPAPPTPVEILENENPLGLVDGGTTPDNILKNAGGFAGNAVNTLELNLPLP